MAEKAQGSIWKKELGATGIGVERELCQKSPTEHLATNMQPTSPRTLCSLSADRCHLKVFGANRKLVPTRGAGIRLGKKIERKKSELNVTVHNTPKYVY